MRQEYTHSIKAYKITKYIFVMKIDKYDKIVAVYLIALFIFLFSTFHYNSLFSDEGTHLMLSVFYKDLITNIAQTGDFSFQHIYQYGINYLVHYPKLQIAYPPLYHLTNAAAFSIFGLYETISRAVNLLYAIGSFLFFYILAKKVFSAKAALFATAMFSFSPLTLFFSSRALQDFSMFFFLLLSVYIFSSAFQHLTKLSKRSIMLFSLTGFVSFLAAMGKQMGGMVIFFFLAILAYNFLRQKAYRKWILANSATLLVVFLLPLIPYIFILNAVGGIEINKMVAIGAASEQGEPVSLTAPLFWIWYPLKLSLAAPFTPLFLLSLAWLVYRKERNWKPLLLWFSVFFILLTLIPNKEPRLAQIFLLPAYAAAGFYLEKIFVSGKRFLLPAFLIIYFVVSLLIFIPTIQYYPAKEIVQEVFSKLPENGNIAIFSEADPLFSSAVMWHARTLDKNENISLYRACAFSNETAEEIMQTLKNNNIHSIVYQTWNPDARIEGIKPYLNLENKITKSNFTTEIYTVKDFAAKEQKEICNYVCLTKQKVCMIK